MLERGVALAYAHGRGACLTTLIVVVLGKAEVYEYGVVLFVEQYVAGLHVKMQYFAFMTVVEGVGYLMYVIQRGGEGGFSTFCKVVERAAVDKFHHIICCVILFENVVYGDYVRVVQCGYCLSLFDEFLAEFFHCFATAARTHRDVRSFRVAFAVVAHEKFLYSNLAVKPRLRGKIGYSEPSVPKLALYSVFAALQQTLCR